MKKSGEWFETHNPEVPKFEKLPAWMRQACRTDDGQIFVPAVMAGSEMEIFLCAGWDGTEIIMSNEHMYVPIDWVMREFPKCREACESIKRRLSQMEKNERI